MGLEDLLGAAKRKVSRAGQYAVLGVTLALSPGYGGCDEQTPCETSEDCGDGQACLEGVCGEGEDSGRCDGSPLVNKYLWNLCGFGTDEYLDEDCRVDLIDSNMGQRGAMIVSGLVLDKIDPNDYDYIELVPDLASRVQSDGWNSLDTCRYSSRETQAEYDLKKEVIMCAWERMEHLFSPQDVYYFIEDGNLCPSYIPRFGLLQNEPWSLASCEEQFGDSVHMTGMHLIQRFFKELFLECGYHE